MRLREVSNFNEVKAAKRLSPSLSKKFKPRMIQEREGITCVLYLEARSLMV